MNLYTAVQLCPWDMFLEIKLLGLKVYTFSMSESPEILTSNMGVKLPILSPVLGVTNLLHFTNLINKKKKSQSTIVLVCISLITTGIESFSCWCLFLIL